MSPENRFRSPFTPRQTPEFMSLWDHLEELRWVLLKCVIVFSLFVGILWFAILPLKSLLDFPLHQGIEWSGVSAAPTLRTQGPMEPYIVFMHLVFFGACGLSLPFCLAFAVEFILPGLSRRERSLLWPVCLAVLALFLAGAAFSYFLLTPSMIAFSFKLNALLNFEAFWSPALYYGTVVWMTFGLGILFELPVVLVLLQYLDLIETASLEAFRRHAFVGILILAALITPTSDPFSFIIVSVPLYLLYEGGILVGRTLCLRKAKAEALLD